MHLRSLDTDPGGFGFMNQLIITSITGDIRRGSAHVESNHGHSSFRGHCITHHATCRTGKDGVAALEMSGIGQTSIGLHEQQFRMLQVVSEPRAKAGEVFLNVWREVCVHHGCITTGDDLDHRHHFMGK